jgi:hypothetical protein
MTELNRWTSGSEYSSCAQSLTQCNTLDALCDLHYHFHQLVLVLRSQHTTLLALLSPLRYFIFVCVSSYSLTSLPLRRSTITRSACTAVALVPTCNHCQYFGILIHALLQPCCPTCASPLTQAHDSPTTAITFTACITVTLSGQVANSPSLGGANFSL